MVGNTDCRLATVSVVDIFDVQQPRVQAWSVPPPFPTVVVKRLGLARPTRPSRSSVQLSGHTTMSNADVVEVNWRVRALIQLQDKRGREGNGDVSVGETAK